MGEILRKKISDDVYGNLIYITNGIIELKASLDFGPRILYFGLCGMENTLYNDLEKKPINGISYPEYKGELMKIYGGHRLWTSPEILPRCYYPDNKPVSLTETENGFILEAPPEEANNIQKSIEVRINEYNSEISVVNAIKNTGTWAVAFSPWAVTVMAANGVCIVPQANRQTGLLSNRALVLWPYTKMNDERVFWGEKYIVIKQNPEIKDSFKIGLNNEKNWAAYFNRGQLFLKYFHHVLDGFYPDGHECSFETYTDGSFLEIETLSPANIVKPKTAVFHEEKWSLYKEDFIPQNDELKIDEVLQKYVD